MAGPGQKCLDLIQKQIDVAGEREVVLARKLDQSRTGNVLGDEARAFDRPQEVSAAGGAFSSY